KALSSMRIRLTGQVYSDLAAVMDYYSQEAGSQIAAEFYSEFKRCLPHIAAFPHSYPVVRQNVRRINFRRFPYHILFEIVEESYVKVLVVKLDRRDPDFGLDR